MGALALFDRMTAWLGALKASEWIGMYGAGLSTALVIAKAWSYFAGPRSIVRVTLALGEIGTFQPGSSERKPTYLVTVVNRSMHAIQVTALELMTADREPRWVLSIPAAGIRLPMEISLRSSANVPLAAEGFADLRRVAIHLATGETVKSNRVKRPKTYGK